MCAYFGKDQSHCTDEANTVKFMLICIYLIICLYVCVCVFVCVCVCVCVCMRRLQ
jgi:hypothetical protein